MDKFSRKLYIEYIGKPTEMYTYLKTLLLNKCNFKKKHRM